MRSHEMNHQEEQRFSEKYKQAYLDGIEKLIADRQKEAAVKRAEYAAEIFTDQERYRASFKEMLGWPLVGYTPNGLPKVSAEKLSEEEGCSLYRMSFEILDGLTLTGLFFKSKSPQKQPLVLLQHGGAGTPELISGIHGSTHNYNHMLERVLKHGVHIFAPQLLLWAEDYGAPYDRKSIDARLKRVGSSITAIEVFGIMRILDYFEQQDYVKNFGMVGLSYGGFYTLCTTAADLRIRAAISCSWFNGRDAQPWSDWTWQNSAEKFDDAEIACLCYPRPLYLAMGDQDELFDAKVSEQSFARIKELCKSAGTDWVQYETFAGKHEFLHTDAPIEQLIQFLHQ